MATDTSKPTEAALKQAPASAKKAKKQRTIIIDPKNLVIAAFVLAAVIFAIVVGVRTVKGPSYPTSPQERAAEAKRAIGGAQDAMAKRVTAGAATAKANQGGLPGRR